MKNEPIKINLSLLRFLELTLHLSLVTFFGLQSQQDFIDIDHTFNRSIIGVIWFFAYILGLMGVRELRASNKRDSELRDDLVNVVRLMWCFVLTFFCVFVAGFQVRTAMTAAESVSRSIINQVTGDWQSQQPSLQLIYKHVVSFDPQEMIASPSVTHFVDFRSSETGRSYLNDFRQAGWSGEQTEGNSFRFSKTEDCQKKRSTIIVPIPTIKRVFGLNSEYLLQMPVGLIESSTPKWKGEQTVKLNGKQFTVAQYDVATDEVELQLKSDSWSAHAWEFYSKWVPYLAPLGAILLFFLNPILDLLKEELGKHWYGKLKKKAGLGDARTMSGDEMSRGTFNPKLSTSTPVIPASSGGPLDGNEPTDAHS